MLDLRNCDCMDLMKEYPDKYFDLAVVDPPYGIGEGSAKIHSRHPSQKKYKAKNWDNEPPNYRYFEELFRVSKNQIIWGSNHFMSRLYIAAPLMKDIDSSCWIVWDKDGFGDQADCELAWTSFKTAVRKYKFTWNGFRKELPQDRIHPTEKPYSLYKWILKNYAKEGDKILDTHLGSGSIAIACHDYKFDLVGCEIDKEYFEAAMKRINNHMAQTTLF